jgi:signal transduction histidine kinase
MKILVAEDDTTSRAVLAGVLQRNGYEVSEVRHGSDALRALQQPDAPRLVILDWLMPQMDGPEVVRRVRLLPTDRPPYIVMLTAKGGKADIVAGLDVGANDYLSKPFDPEELLARLAVGRRMIEMQDALATKNDQLRQSQADLHVLAARLQAVREEERASLARELHDSFGQHLTALQIDLMWMDRHLQSTRAPDLAVLCDRIVAMVPQVERLTEQTQAICTALRPSVLFELGLVAAIEWQTEDMAKRSDIICTRQLPAEDVELDQPVALALFRIVQESLTNVLRHAQATRVEVRLWVSDEALELVIEDNGCGYAPRSTTGSQALGLLGIRERVDVFGGTVEFTSAPGQGAAVRVCMPLPVTAISNPQNGGTL